MCSHVEELSIQKECVQRQYPKHCHNKNAPVTELLDLFPQPSIRCETRRAKMSSAVCELTKPGWWLVKEKGVPAYRVFYIWAGKESRERIYRLVWEIFDYNSKARD